MRTAADINTVARSHSHTIGAGRRTPPPPGAGGRALVLTAVGATAMVVAPIALWLRFGDDNPVRTIAIATASILLSAGLVSFVRRPRYSVYGLKAPVTPSAHGRDAIRRSLPLPKPAPRMRAGSPASTYRARPLRPLRPSRNVQCRSAVPRAARRRTRP